MKRRTVFIWTIVFMTFLGAVSVSAFLMKPPEQGESIIIPGWSLAQQVVSNLRGASFGGTSRHSDNVAKRPIAKALGPAGPDYPIDFMGSVADTDPWSTLGRDGFGRSPHPASLDAPVFLTYASSGFVPSGSPAGSTGGAGMSYSGSGSGGGGGGGSGSGGVSTPTGTAKAVPTLASTGVSTGTDGSGGSSGGGSGDGSGNGSTPDAPISLVGSSGDPNPSMPGSVQDDPPAAATPEPATLLLAGPALALLPWLRRRRGKAAS
ncbi:hypothetical protein dsx2_1164 [Desulfovibrio sp. X2]|uniref:hypothetical protein n=1 Tax=Desulfovibrio sp. X2 TaxID=941449 RepID=UPI000358AA03|nr:hypothetical protein [Desulfovibrio sp. X2]EPR37221.1 hypothetical protein dsx2_1164 [Desulfovibrio sp. X2]